MTDEYLAAAQQVIADAETGAYDAQFGISAEERALLTKAAGPEVEGGGGPLTVADVASLSRLGWPELIDAAHRAGRIDLTTDGDIA